MLDASTVDQDVKPAEAFDDSVGQPIALRSIGQVGLEVGQLGAERLDPLAEFIALVGDVDAG